MQSKLILQIFDISRLHILYYKVDPFGQVTIFMSLLFNSKGILNKSSSFLSASEIWDWSGRIQVTNL